MFVEPPWIDDQGRPFLTRGQSHPGRKVLTLFEFWFRGTSYVGKVYGG